MAEASEQSKQHTEEGELQHSIAPAAERRDGSDATVMIETASPQVSGLTRLRPPLAHRLQCRLGPKMARPLLHLRLYRRPRTVWSPNIRSAGPSLRLFRRCHRGPPHQDHAQLCLMSVKARPQQQLPTLHLCSTRSRTSTCPFSTCLPCSGPVSDRQGVRVCHYGRKASFLAD